MVERIRVRLPAVNQNHDENMLRAAPDNEVQLREDTPLVDGTHMWCPNCKSLHDVLSFVRLQRRKACSNQTVDIVKCPNCRFLFAPMVSTDLKDFS